MKKLITLLFLVLFVPALVFGDAALIDEVAGAPAAGGPDEWIGFETEIDTETVSPVIGTVKCSALDAPSANGTITKIAIYSYCTIATVDIKVGIYTAADGSPDGDSPVGAETEFQDIGIYGSTGNLEWHEFTGLSYAVTSGVDYVICWDTSGGGLNLMYDSVGGTNRWYDENTSYATAWPDPFTDSGNSAAKYQLRAWVD